MSHDSPEITRLPNGLRVVSYHMPHVETVSLGVWVGVGARHETENENGISHFLEHMAFKGTTTRSARLIAEEIEQVGGELNAATSLETTAYYARVLRGDVSLALELIADILRNPLYAVDELEREREVILQEIAGTRDSPEDIAYDLFGATAYPAQALGRPVLGTKQTVKRFTADDIRAFLLTHYCADRMVVAAAGHVDHASFTRKAEALFGDMPAAVAGGDGRFAQAEYRGGFSASEKTFEQAHLLIGFEGPSYREPAFYAAQVFSGLLGGGMSSRLFQEVRERRGLCYSIFSSAWGLGDTGMLSIYAATGKDMLTELVGVVGGELRSLADNAPDVREIERARAQLKVGLAMSLESSGARAEQIARHLLVHDRVIPAAELIARVEAVTAQDLSDYARQLLNSKRPTAVVVGAGKASRKHAERTLAAFAQQRLVANA